MNPPSSSSTPSDSIRLPSPPLSSTVSSVETPLERVQQWTFSSGDSNVRNRREEIRSGSDSDSGSRSRSRWYDTTVPPRLKDLPPRPYWCIVVGTCLLAVNGGYLSSVSFAGVSSVGVTTLTRTTTLAGSLSVNSKYETEVITGGFILGLVFMYLMGAVVGGYILGDRRTKWRGRQGSALSLVSVLIWIAFSLLESGSDWHVAVLFIASAASLQNSTTSTLDIIQIRTANVTGTVIDMGLALGHSFRDGIPPHAWKLCLWVPVFCSFFCGACLGAASFNRFSYRAYIASGVFVSLCSIGTFVYACLDRRRHLVPSSLLSRHPSHEPLLLLPMQSIARE